MPQTDPLAVRHGALIAQVWEQIALARRAAKQNLPQDRAAFWCRRIRHLRRQVMQAHRVEMARSDASTPAIDGWFAPVTRTLDRAEGYFAAMIATHALENAKTAAR